MIQYPWPLTPFKPSTRPKNETPPKADSIWPGWAEEIRLAKVEGETGVGDTLHRITQGEILRWIKLNVGTCACRGERAWLNQRYPY